jgi:hypothetical protein
MILRGNINEIKKKLSNIQNLFLITNNNTKHFSGLYHIENHICVQVNIQQEIFLQNFINFFYLTKEILFYELQKVYQLSYNKIIQDLMQQNLSVTISPLGVANTDINIINEENISDLPETIILNHDFLQLHQMMCSLKPIRSLLLGIIQYYSFSLSDFQEFLILSNLVIKFGIFGLPIKIYNCIKKALKDLEDNYWNINKQKFYEYFYDKQDDFISSVTYWQNIFQETSIKMCECFFVSCKDITKYTYYRLKNPATLSFLNPHIKSLKRHIIIPLEKPIIVKNTKQFYIEKILKIKIPKKLQENQNTKVFSLKKHYLSDEFNFIY